jgi:tetratricopeptide (TPR) repeat protein
VSSWWFPVQPLDACDVGLDGVLKSASTVGVSSTGYARLIAVVTEEWNAMDVIMKIELKAGVHGFRGQCTNQPGLQPGPPEILTNYALLCKGFKRYEDAERYCLQAIERAADYCDARNNLSQLYPRMRRLDEAIEQACESLIRNPNASRARYHPATACLLLGRNGEAVRICQEWLEYDPDNPRARHHLAALAGEGVPARAGDDDVKLVFDAFAESFDAQLARLEYQAPRLVGEKVADRLGTAPGQYDVRDAGPGRVARI